MQCPKCQAKLVRQFYEKLPVHHCPNCAGTLLSEQRLQAIKARRDKKLDDFREELSTAADNPAAGDTAKRIRCPKCLLGMEKRSKPFGPATFAIDRCRKCKLFWLDAGELAKLQLIFETSQAGLERERIRQRLENMSPAQKAAFEARIASLPEPSFLSELLSSYATEGGGSRWDTSDLDFLFDD